MYEEHRHLSLSSWPRPVHWDPVEAEDVSISSDHLVSLHREASLENQLRRGSAVAVSREGGSEAVMKRPGCDVIWMKKTVILDECWCYVKCYISNIFLQLDNYLNHTSPLII